MKVILEALGNIGSFLAGVAAIIIAITAAKKKP